MTDIYSQQRRNRRLTILLIAAFFIILGILGYAIDSYTFRTIKAAGLPIATIIAVLLASINGFVAYFYGDNVVVFSLHARPLEFENPLHKKLHNIVTEMALASGLPMPKIYIIPDPAPNAFATGRDPRSCNPSSYRFACALCPAFFQNHRNVRISAEGIFGRRLFSRIYQKSAQPCQRAGKDKQGIISCNDGA
ncbi:MAG: M48 family metalloprotease [Deltaproteobacteria bacterium]|nr:M48 family metalloprotease [Deltaproteobacteria bacterium]